MGVKRGSADGQGNLSAASQCVDDVLTHRTGTLALRAPMMLRRGGAMPSHAGGCAPFIAGRWEHGYHSIPECQTTPKPPSDYFKMMYFDSIVHSGPALLYLVNMVGANRVLLGSDYPFPMGESNPVTTLRSAVGLSIDDIQKIAGQNSAVLLKI